MGLDVLLGVVDRMHLVSAHSYLVNGLLEELDLGIQSVLIFKLARREPPSLAFATLTELVDNLLSLLLQR